MSNPPRVEKPNQTEQLPIPDKREWKTFVAFKQWLRERDWKRVTGNNGAFRAAAVTGTLGLVLAVCLLGSWIFRAKPTENEIPDQLETLAEGAGVQASPIELPNLVVDLGEPESGIKPVAKVINKPVAKESVQVAAIDSEPLPEPPVQASPKPVAPAVNAPAEFDPFAADPVTKSPPVTAEEPVATVVTKAVTKEPEPSLDDQALSETPPVVTSKPAVENPVVEKPVEEKPDPDLAEPVVPVEEMPKVIVEKSEKVVPKEDEPFGGSDRGALIERGTSIVPTAAAPEEPALKPETPAKPAVSPEEELPASEPVAEKAIVEVKKEEVVPADVKPEVKNEPESPALKDDEPFGSTSGADKKDADKPEITTGPANDKKDPVVEPPVTAPVVEKPVEKPAETKPNVVEPEPATATSPFADDPPLSSKTTPENPVKAEPAPVADPKAELKPEPKPEPQPEPKVEPKAEPKLEPKEQPAVEPEVTTPPEKREPRPQPVLDRVPVKPTGITPTAGPSVAPQIDFELIAPLQSKKGEKFEIGFKVTNIGTTDIDGLVFSIRLPASLKHRAGRDVEYRLDRLAAGQSHSAEMHVIAENTEVALIRAEMAVGKIRLATSDRQINIHGVSPTGFIQKTSGVVPAGYSAPQRPRFFAWPNPASEFDCHCGF